jgi:glycerol kinase
VSPVLEATTLGAAYLAGMALGIWADPEEIAGIWSPREVVRPAVSPSVRSERRHRWMAARDKARGTIPELSTLEF